MINYIIVGIVILTVALAIRSIYRNKKNGGCCGGCSGCSSQSGCNLYENLGELEKDVSQKNLNK